MKMLTQEMIEKAKSVNSAEELYELAKANGFDITADEAKTYFEQLNPKSGELEDDDLDRVAGGADGCKDKDEADKFPLGTKLRVTSGQTCPICGSDSGEVKWCVGKWLVCRKDQGMIVKIKPDAYTFEVIG